MIKDDCGEPAFDNIEELLSGKIRAHGVAHADRSEPSDQAAAAAPSTTASDKKCPRKKVRIIPFIIIAAVTIVVLCRLLHRASHPSAK